MPCDSSHCEATRLEKYASEIAFLLDEIKGKPTEKHFRGGYHPDIYNKCSRELADRLTAKLCAKLRRTGAKKYSLEMQIWWRDHKEADAEKVRRAKIVAKM